MLKICKHIFLDDLEICLNIIKSEKFSNDPKSVQLISKMCLDNLKRVWMIWKISIRSKKCLDNLKNVSGYLDKSPDDLELCLGDLDLL